MAISTMAKDLDKPFHVCQIGAPNGGFCKGFDSEDEANADAKERNAKAQEMGIKATYEMRLNPPNA